MDLRSPADLPRNLAELQNYDSVILSNVAAWELHAGPSAGALAVVGKARRTGFETAIAVPHGARYARVVALDAAGKRLRASRTIRV